VGVSSFPPSTRKEKLQREFPRREHYLLRAFEWLKGWTLADSEAAAVAGTERLRSRASACRETVRRGGGSPSGDRPRGFRRKAGGGGCGGARPTTATATADGDHGEQQPFHHRIMCPGCPPPLQNASNYKHRTSNTLSENIKQIRHHSQKCQKYCNH
jgi:hypothetical protein